MLIPVIVLYVTKCGFTALKDWNAPRLKETMYSPLEVPPSGKIVRGVDFPCSAAICRSVICLTISSRSSSDAELFRFMKRIPMMSLKQIKSFLMSYLAMKPGFGSDKIMNADMSKADKWLHMLIPAPS